MQAPTRLQQRLRLFDATTIVAGSMIGSAIFIAPSIMARCVQTPGILLGLWVFGGLFTLLGALCYAELASMMPHAGGQYVFLGQAFGRFWAFLYGWTLFLVIQTGFNAAVAIAFAKYLGIFFGPLAESNVIVSLPLGKWLPVVGTHLPAYLRDFQLSTAQIMACGVIVLLTWINILGVRQGAAVQNLFTVLKVAALGAIVVVGLPRVAGSAANFLPLVEFRPGKTALEKGLFAALALALSKALFAYDAWNSGTFVAEEVRQPEQTVPRALLSGAFLVMLLYVLTNVAYLAVIPIGAMANVAEDRVAEPVAVALFGQAGSTLVIVAILISTFGCVNGLILSGARVSYAMARQGLFFRSCARLHPRSGTPAVALVYQAVWSCVLTLTGSYDDLLTYTTFASVLFGALTVVGLYRLRVTEPNRPRPHRCWGYPVTPALYLAIALPFLGCVILGDPRATLIGLGLVMTGVPVYLYWHRQEGKSVGEQLPSRSTR
jgi:APA family basic amino acid/polyamine antiporter